MTRLASGFDRAAESTELLLWRVTNRWQATQRAVLKPFELTDVQFVLLASLTWCAEEGAVTQRALEARGLVIRLPHPDNGRAITVAVMDAGIALVNRAIRFHAKLEALVNSLAPA